MDILSKNNIEIYRMMDILSKNNIEIYQEMDILSKNNIEIYRMMDILSKNNIEIYRVMELTSTDFFEIFRMLGMQSIKDIEKRELPEMFLKITGNVESYYSFIRFIAIGLVGGWMCNHVMKDSYLRIVKNYCLMLHNKSGN